jgi:uncharacterized protein with GYD domain
MASYIVLSQFTEQGVRTVHDTTKRAAVAKDMAAKAGVKLIDVFWTIGPCDVVIIAEAPDDETMAAFVVSTAKLGNIKPLTLRAFKAGEVDKILAKVA